MGEVHVIITTKKVGDKGKIVNPPCKIVDVCRWRWKYVQNQTALAALLSKIQVTVFANPSVI